VERAAIIPCGTWLRAEMSKMLPKDFEMVFMNCPVYDDGKGDPTLVYTGVDGFGWCIPAKAKNPDLAADFYRYMTSAENAKAFIEIKGAMMSVLVEGPVNAPPHLSEPLRLVREAGATYSAEYANWYPDFNVMVNNSIVHMLNHKLTPEEFVNQVANEAENVRKDPTIYKFEVE
jgi:N-acetylglucosamine transport system substrate-binding protein